MMASALFVWTLIAFVAMHLFVACYRVPRWAKLTGRSPLLWFFITLFFTALPAAVVHYVDQMRNPPPLDRQRRWGRGQAKGRRCSRCGAEIAPDPDGAQTCPQCGASDEDGAIA